MGKRKSTTIEADSLRHTAETRLGQSHRTLDQTERLAHDLEVHRIELDLQNEELQRAAVSLKASVDQYSELYDLAPVGYFTLDASGAIRRVNLTGASLFCATERANLLHRRFGILVSPADRATFHKLLEEVFSPAERGSCEVAIEPATVDENGFPLGSRRRLRVRLTATRSPDEDECRIVAMDVTELSRLHDELLISARMSSLGVLAAGIAHEINNPLAVVMANLDAALKQLRRKTVDFSNPPGSLDDTIETLGECLEGAERVRQIVGDLKLFSRNDEQREELVDLRKVVTTAIKLANNELRHRATTVTEYLDVPPVRGNEGRLGQVILNLLINAAQSLPEGQVDRHTITVRTLTHESGCAVVEVHDTGVGISPVELTHIFEPFFTTKPIGSGTGLGLAICNQIVTGAGGQITVDSELGRGTCFRVFLPRAAEATAQAVPPDAAALSGRRARILMIDDDDAVLKATARTLAQRHEVIAVAGAQAALEKIMAGEQFDLIICDLMMPVITGVEFHRSLSRIAPALARRMIFLTAGAFTPVARDFLASVDNLTVGKPYDPDRLLAAVDRAVR